MTIPCQEATVSYDEKKRNTILDYLVDVKKLAQSDRILNYAGANYSVTGPLYTQYIPHKDYQEILEYKVSCHVT
jgi:hypothetical protein